MADLEAALTGNPQSHANSGDETTYYLLTDHLGSVDVVLDDLGTVVERRDYLPYGSERISESTPDATKTDHKFTGKELDSETGLHYYGARYYDAEIGRFVSVDPLVLDEAKMTEEDLLSILNNPQKLDAYTYALNNPVLFVDLYGESAYTERWKGVGEIIDGVLHCSLGTAVMLSGGGAAQLIGGAAVQQEGVFEVAWGTAQMATGNSLKIGKTENNIVKVTNKVLGFAVKGAGTVGSLAKTSLSTGYAEAFEAVGEMIENDVSLNQFTQSISDAIDYEFDNAVSIINRYTNDVKTADNNPNDDEKDEK